MVGRARRSTAKAVNYAKEQEFSDTDVFEDSDKEEAAPKRRGRPRKSDVAEVRHEMDDDGYSTRPVFTEKGYDPSLPPIRERFDFMPEYELDGSPKIDLIVGRRPVDDKNAETSGEEGEDASDDDSTDSDEGKRKTRKKQAEKKQKKRKGSPSKKKGSHKNEHVEYEYLVKYKGRSYLHLEWKTGADLESLNKSAKSLYRRYLRKIAAGQEEDIEDPNFDPSYAEPQKVVDECEQELNLELTDKELVEWEKERQKALEKEEADADADAMAIEGAEDEEEKEEEVSPAPKEDGNEEKKAEEPVEEGFNPDEDIDFSTLPLDKLRRIVNKDGPYYPVFKGCDNPYRDGYITEPPKKPRASYLFFQGALRPYFAKRNPDASQNELMKLLGDTWQNMSEQEQAPFIQLAREEAQEYENERALMEKAQKPNEMWQPLRRCLMVLNRLAKDGFANIFLEPVDLNEFTDYEEIIDSPMDLGTIRKKLADKKYQAPENFARDVRKVWNNCKIYNQHGSAIWYVADYMSKQFERLYHAWVLEFRERYLRWINPLARPWEHTCRKCDGKCGTPDNKMVLCDHCDAMYGLECLEPPLSKPPEGVWHCPDCSPKLHTVKGVRMYSAVSEQAARRRAELGEIPKKQVKQTMYLVKWAGLGYEFCTWETKEDINDDALIDEFHRLNDVTLHEPDLTKKELNEFLDNVKHTSIENAGGISCMPDIRAQLYAQTRAFHFSKFGADIPDKLSGECGPKTTATAEDDQSDSEGSGHVKEVVECVSDMLYKVSRHSHMIVNASLPPLLTGEYDAVIPITSKGLMMNVGEHHGSVSFLGYRSFPDGSKGPAELANLVRGVGDKIIAVDGTSTINKTFKEVIMLLRESGKNKFCFMRFLESKYSVVNCELTSVGTVGRYTADTLRKKLTRERKGLLVRRKHQLLSEEDTKVAEEEDKHGDRDSDEDDESDEGSEGSFEPDSDDEELVRESDGISMVSTPKGAGGDKSNSPATGIPPNVSSGTTPPSLEKEKLEATPSSATADNGVNDGAERPCKIRQETTRSLAFRLLEMDVGYSSDEGGDDDCAHFLDGVDGSFSTRAEAAASEKKKKAPEKEDEDATVCAKKRQFADLNARGKLCAAMVLTEREPEPEDFENFPLPSQKEMEAEKEREAQKAAEDRAKEQPPEPESTDADGNVSPSKSVNRSTVKVEQVSTTTGETVRVWANVEVAAATLQLPLDDMKNMIKGEYDEYLVDEIGGYRWRYAAAGAEVTAGAGDSGKSRGDKKGKKAYLEFRDKLYDPAVPHVYKNGNRLRDYQVDGVNWLASTWYKKHSCILADEMGLGKTVQIVSYIEHLYRVEKIRRPYLVVVPLSTVEHWRREFQGWTDMVCCVYHDRQRIWRDVMREYEWYYEDRPHTSEYLKFDVLVTTYDTLIGDFDIIKEVPWRVAVVDEAHRLRNIKGKLLECMKEISARGTLQYGFQSRILMTGTPLQNNTQELWTLLNFIEPFKFPSLEEFEAKFGNMANRAQVEALQQKISPYMLRRVKEDVAKDIPEKEETLIDVELTSTQKQYYRAIFEHNHAFLSMGATRSNAPKLMNIQMELRKCCNHPYLLEGVEQRENEKYFGELVERGDFVEKSPEQQQLLLNEHGYIQTSGKMVLLDKLLPKLRQEGHKVLIFSQMVRMLDLISEYCDFRGFRHERLDGRVRGNERQKSIDRFESDPDIFVFLLSTRAGGVGINLTAADTCIIFDSDWNPQNDVQAQARCHRIGQSKNVRVYRLITSRTFEQEMFDRASKKLGLEQAVLGTLGDNDDDKPTTKEMEQLLKKGAYALIEDENDEKGKEFCADDIDSILAKRTRTRVVEGAKTASWLNKQGMVVSKSRFAGDNSASAGVDVDDPLFWQKVMPDFVTPTIMLTKLDELTADIEGGAKKVGRGRGRKKKQEAKEESAAKDENEEPHLESKAEAEKEDEAKEHDTDMAEAGQHAPDVSPSKAGADKDGGDEAKEQDAEMAEAEQHSPDVSPSKAGEDEGDGDEAEDGKGKKPLSRTNKRKVHKYMADLKSMMDGIFVDAEDDSLPPSEKSLCQKLLLTISVKERVFNEEQRKLARTMLKRLEGDRRRRCRTTAEQTDRSPSRRSRRPEAEEGAVREELLILSKHQRKKRRKQSTSGPPQKRSKKGSDEEDSGGRGYVGEDGYLHHSDSEADWSDVGEDIYKAPGRKRSGISKKEASRRRAWATEGDAATAAGRPWPALPRHLIKKILSHLLDEVIKYDESKTGIFSTPVPRDTFPEYYEAIEQPMDYGTMRQKLENGEYRSAQAMQKDFILVMQNCLKFNAPDSDIVSEARQQALMRPELLRNAAMKEGIFLAEDGSALEVYSDGEEKEGKGDTKKKKRRKKKEAAADDGEEAEENVARIPRKSKKASSKRGKVGTKSKSKKEPDDASADSSTEDEDDEMIASLRKPRIRITLPTNGDDGEGKKKMRGKKTKKKKSKTKAAKAGEVKDASVDDGNFGDDEKTPARKHKRKRSDQLAETAQEGEPKPKAVSRKRKKKNPPPAAGVAEENTQVASEEPRAPVEEAVELTTGPKDSQADSDETGAVWLDVALWEKEREALDGSFKAARAHFVKRGPWQPAVDDSKFSEIAKQTLHQMDRHDKYSVFAEGVTEEEAPGYFEVVKNPMDFGTMRKKVDDGAYEQGTNAFESLYNDFLLVFDNCALYNVEGEEVAVEAARVFGLLPETFAKACAAAAAGGKKKAKGAK